MMSTFAPVTREEWRQQCLDGERLLREGMVHHERMRDTIATLRAELAAASGKLAEVKTIASNHSYDYCDCWECNCIGELLKALGIIHHTKNPAALESEAKPDGYECEHCGNPCCHSQICTECEAKP